MSKRKKNIKQTAIKDTLLKVEKAYVAIHLRKLLRDEAYRQYVNGDIVGASGLTFQQRLELEQ